MEHSFFKNAFKFKLTAIVDEIRLFSPINYQYLNNSQSQNNIKFLICSQKKKTRSHNYNPLRPIYQLLKTKINRYSVKKKQFAKSDEKSRKGICITNLVR